MRDIVTEDIIRNALNESIDEFMLEEGWEGWKNLWNSPNVQKIRNGVGKAWNGYKNFLSMYMDNKTNGQWNNKYGIYAIRSGKTTELYYLEKWFGYHLNEIRGIARRLQDPSHFSKTEIEWERDTNDPTKQRSTQTIYKYEDIPTYVKNMITPYNFNMWIKNFIKDRESLRAIDGYIEYCSKNINDINSAIKLLNISSFMSSRLGQYYLSRDKSSQKTSKQWQQQMTQRQQQMSSAKRQAQSKGQQQRDNANNNVQGVQSYWANKDENPNESKRKRKTI